MFINTDTNLAIFFICSLIEKKKFKKRTILLSKQNKNVFACFKKDIKLQQFLIKNFQVLRKNKNKIFGLFILNLVIFKY